eukprot:CAMPEP_0170066482 /NCGR_PEP_ID=MMETSP0019_2-20121128/6165_1 /TAXON_ID=98059 /ORGANISM="Dinobryon sp., Strain UTEXLB2267" /LENGTH=236 /DNA_ID=CAMNT_0010273587 /DNA_START=323 /DNA_END=1033 /DNA_ORIENTATION=+
MNHDISNANDFLTSSKKSVIFITLGTTKVHILKENGCVVANCHKQPGKLFETKVLSLSTIIESLRHAISVCKALNKDIQIVFTVSPVRHTRDGIIENSLSKSTLLCAVHALKDEFPEFVSYFPAYEYMIDELRDYRWYEEDMIHPSKLAREFFLSKFLSSYTTADTQDLCEKISKINNNINHKPRFPETEAYRKHLSSTILAMLEMQDKHGIDFSSDIDKLQNYYTSTNVSKDPIV